VETGVASVAAYDVDASGSRLYVSDAAAREVVAIDITTQGERVPVVRFQVGGRPGPIAYHAQHAALYVLTDNPSASIVRIEPDILAMRAVPTHGHGGVPTAIRVAGGTVLAGFQGELVVMDIASGNLSFIAAGANARAIAYDPVSGKSFLVTPGVLMVLDPRTMRYETVATDPQAKDVAFIYKTCKAFAAGPQALTVAHVPCGDIPPDINAQGLWWVPAGAESGWGINVTHQGDKLFATWFTYNDAGQPVWYVMSSGERIGRNRYTGTLYQTDGPSFASARFDPARVTYAAVGSLTLDVWSVDRAQLAASINGTIIRKELAKQQFALPMPVCGTDLAPGAQPNYTDLWWASPPGVESGWGLNVVHQGDTLFITWFTYDTNSYALWFVGSSMTRTGNGTYSGTLYRTVGPPANASPWDPARVTRMPTGSATLTFRDSASGTFRYDVGSHSSSKEITRQIYAAPQTTCR
jgi:hypothetical protein